MPPGKAEYDTLEGTTKPPGPYLSRVMPGRPAAPRRPREGSLLSLTMSGSSFMPRGERPMPKRVQSELNGRVFEATDFRWALLILSRERMLTDAEMAAPRPRSKSRTVWPRGQEPRRAGVDAP